jgi:hypothetical protein
MIKRVERINKEYTIKRLDKYLEKKWEKSQRNPKVERNSIKNTIKI